MGEKNKIIKLIKTVCHTILKTTKVAWAAWWRCNTRQVHIQPSHLCTDVHIPSDPWSVQLRNTKQDLFFPQCVLFMLSYSHGLNDQTRTSTLLYLNTKQPAQLRSNSTRWQKSEQLYSLKTKILYTHCDGTALLAITKSLCTAYIPEDPDLKLNSTAMNNFQSALSSILLCSKTS